MVTFGLDISHHQAASLNLAQCRREGIEFIFIKATEGSSFVDSAFAANLNEAHAAGLLVAAYHYVKSDATAAAQVANVARVVPKDVPVIPDVEANSGGIALVRDFVTRLQAAGYHVPLTYLPRWYWQQIGSPSLVGLPPLWSSRYPDNVAGSVADEFGAVPASYWNGYGGLGVTVLQFTSSARMAGYQPLDANAFNGTREQLAALLEEDMPTAEEIAAAVWAHGIKFQDLPDNPGGPAWMHLSNGNLAAQQSNAKLDQLTDDEATVIATVRGMLTEAGDTIAITDQQVQALAAAISKATPAAITPQMLADAFRQVADGLHSPDER